MRRTVATLLVVASPLLTAVPVRASDARPAGRAPLPGTPVVVQAPAPAVPAPVTVVPPAAQAVVKAPAVAPAAPAVARPAVKAVRVKAPRAAAVTDAAYAARLQAELCRARQIFCGLDNGGRYPAR